MSRTQLPIDIVSHMTRFYKEETPFNAPSVRAGTTEARHKPAALRHMHDVVTCGVDGGSIKPPDEWRR